MIVVTGAAGFIGSYLVGKLNQTGYNDLVLVDKFDDTKKEMNWLGKKYRELIDRDVFHTWLFKNAKDVDFVFHIGARSDTLGRDPEIYQQLNLNYSKRLWTICSELELPFLYASSAATYGNGEFGFSDSQEKMAALRPLNLYGWSKHDFDVWALKQTYRPPFWSGMKFFNVYGSNEYHKGRMASVVLHAHKTIEETGKMQLFRSHNKAYGHGEQSRDFIYIADIADVMLYFMEKQHHSGIYNVGTGKARSFLDLTTAVFNSMGIEPDISFVDTPLSLRKHYQYFTEAEIQKLRDVGYKKPFVELEDGVEEYVNTYLRTETCY